MIFQSNILTNYQNGINDQNLSIYNNVYPAVIKFPENLLRQSTAILSLISGYSEERHGHLSLKLVGEEDSNKDFLIDENSDIKFPIKKRKYELKFIGIYMNRDGSRYKDINDARFANTARFKLTVFNESQSDPRTEKSGLIRNKNYENISDEIHMSTFGPDLTLCQPSKTYVVHLSKPIPYFPDEISIKAFGHREAISPFTNEIVTGRDIFPTFTLYFDVERPIPTEACNLEFIIMFLENSKSSYEAPKKQETIKKECRKSKCSIEQRKKKSKADFTDEDILSKFDDIHGDQDNQGKSENKDIPAIAESDTTSTIKELCLIISYTDFEDTSLKSRNLGAEEDVKNIKSVFGYFLNYNVEIRKNLGSHELENEINILIKDKIKDVHQNVVVFVLSHGYEEGFCTFDGKMTFRDLVSLFLPENCPALKNSEKVFFYSCCLGNEINGDIVPLIYNNESDADTVKSRETKKDFQPKHSNIFEGFSTIEGYQSVRDANGTPYIQDLMETIRKHPNCFEP